MNGESYSLMEPYLSFVKKGCDYLDWTSALNLLNSINVKISSKERAKEYFRKYSDAKDCKFYFSDFVYMIRRLRSHPVISYLFAENSKNDVMTAEMLVEFFKNEQKQGNSPLTLLDVLPKFRFGLG